VLLLEPPPSLHAEKSNIINIEEIRPNNFNAFIYLPPLMYNLDYVAASFLLFGNSKSGSSRPWWISLF
jgi:hypothetical protein